MPSLLADARVARLFATYTASSFGSAVGSVAMAFVAYRESGSVVLTVLVLAGNTLPYVLVAPVSGRLMTSRDGRVPLAGSQVGKGAVLGVIAVLAGVGELTYGRLLVGSFVYGTLSALADPVWPRMNEAIAPPGRLPDVVALFQAGRGIAMVVGAFAGGVILTLLGEAWAFALDAATYVPVALVIAAAPHLDPVPRSPEGVLRTAMQSVAKTVVLRRAFLLVAVLNLAALPVVATLPAIADDIEPSGHVLGLLTGAYFAGAALVALSVVRLRRHFPYSHLLRWGFLVAGALLLVHVGLTNWRDPGYDAVVTAVITLLPIGLVVSMNSSLLQALVQLESRDAGEGGVMLLYMTVIALLAPIGGVLIGVAADTWSLWWALGGSGAVLVVLSLLLRTRFAVFDALDGPAAESRVRVAAREHWSAHLRHAVVADVHLPGS